MLSTPWYAINLILASVVFVPLQALGYGGGCSTELAARPPWGNAIHSHNYTHRLRVGATVECLRWTLDLACQLTDGGYATGTLCAAPKSFETFRGCFYLSRLSPSFFLNRTSNVTLN